MWSLTDHSQGSHQLLTHCLVWVGVLLLQGSQMACEINEKKKRVWNGSLWMVMQNKRRSDLGIWCHFQSHLVCFIPKSVVYPCFDRAGLFAGSPENAYGPGEKPRLTLPGRTGLSFVVQCCLRVVQDQSCLCAEVLAGLHTILNTLIWGFYGDALSYIRKWWVFSAYWRKAMPSWRTRLFRVSERNMRIADTFCVHQFPSQCVAGCRTGYLLLACMVKGWENFGHPRGGV